MPQDDSIDEDIYPHKGSVYVNPSLDERRARSGPTNTKTRERDCCEAVLTLAKYNNIIPRYSLTYQDQTGNQSAAYQKHSQ